MLIKLRLWFADISDRVVSQLLALRFDSQGLLQTARASHVWLQNLHRELFPSIAKLAAVNATQHSCCSVRAPGHDSETDAK